MNPYTHILGTWASVSPVKDSSSIGHQAIIKAILSNINETRLDIKFAFKQRTFSIKEMFL